MVAYDGTDFAGSQLQLAQRTVQGELERAAEIMTGHPTRMRAAGRTDAGVHALAQVVAFDSARQIPPKGFLMGLNRALPPDLRVQRVALCPAGYNPRYDALQKTYRYVVQVGQIHNPLLRERAYQLNKLWSLDIEAMRAAASQLEGTHDFRAFRQADDVRDNSVRTLYSIEVSDDFDDDPSLIGITVRGTAFMKNMVRIIAGTLVAVGRGQLTPKQVAALLSAEATRSRYSDTAPAHGLTLVHVSLGRSHAQASR
jgi:tRNA pseudouridine38-40 synthase